jgi:hypothetical protein
MCFDDHQLCTVLDPLVGQHPADPRLQRWIKIRDEWAKELSRQE